MAQVETDEKSSTSDVIPAASMSVKKLDTGYISGISHPTALAQMKQVAADGNSTESSSGSTSADDRGNAEDEDRKATVAADAHVDSRALFEKLDKDGSGWITFEDVED